MLWCYDKVPTYIALFVWFTAERNAAMDELDALLAATARNNNDNATQHGNYHISFDIFTRVVRLYGSFTTLWDLVICLLRKVAWLYNVILRFTAELVAEIDELDALLAAPVPNNNSAQNGKYILHIKSIYSSYIIVYLDSVCIFRY